MTESAVASPRRQPYYLTPLLALEFLTVLRLRRPSIVDADSFGQSQAFFPVVGLLLGGLLAGADWLLRDTFGAAITGWALVALLLVLSGGLHADGLADTVDGLFGGHTRQRRLEIMRDSAIGAYGVAALVVVLALKATAIGQLATDNRAQVLVLAPALSRWACVAAIAAFPYARPEGLGTAFHAQSFPWTAPVAALTCVAAAVVGFGLVGAVAWLLAVGACLALGAFVSPKLGGMTGDSYGAVVEITETLALLAAVAWF